jgi:hypothetical protein
MSSNTAQRWVLWLCFAGYVLASAIGLNGFVLCFGPQGHVAIEMASSLDCNGCVAQPDCDAEEPHDELAPECPCDDVALPGANLLARKFDLESNGKQVPPALPLVFVAPRAVELQVTADARDSAHDFAAVNRAARVRPRSAVLLV